MWIFAWLVDGRVLRIAHPSRSAQRRSIGRYRIPALSGKPCWAGLCVQPHRRGRGSGSFRSQQFARSLDGSGGHSAAESNSLFETSPTEGSIFHRRGAPGTGPTPWSFRQGVHL